MDDGSNRSYEALEGTEDGDSKASDEGERGIRYGEVEEGDERRRSLDGSRSDCAAESCTGGESKTAESETLDSLHPSGGDFKVDCDECSHNLDGNFTVPSLIVCVFPFSFHFFFWNY